MAHDNGTRQSECDSVLPWSADAARLRWKGSAKRPRIGRQIDLNEIRCPHSGIPTRRRAAPSGELDAFDMNGNSLRLCPIE